MRGEAVVATARVRLDQDAAWKLLFNALPEREAAAVADVSGDTELARVLWRARSVIV